MDKEMMARLAMRVEGDWWCAYYARMDTMKDAIPLGTLHMRLAIDPARKAAFMSLMKSAIGDLIKEEFGQRPDWGGARVAPEHERSGSA